MGDPQIVQVEGFLRQRHQRQIKAQFLKDLEKVLKEKIFFQINFTNLGTNANFIFNYVPFCHKSTNIKKPLK
jgi:hypothetical protein